MLKALATKLDTLGYRLALFDEIARLERAGRYLPPIRRRVLRSPTRYDDFIQMLAFLDNNVETLLIDVGANLGNFTTDFRTLYRTGASWLFEPNPDCRLAERMPGCIVQPFGAGEASATLELRVPGDALGLGTLHGYNSLAQDHYGHEAYTTHRVEIRRLDSFDLPSAPQTVLKIDTQGHEVDVLRGAGKVLDRVDLVLLECSFAPVHNGDRPTFTECAAILATYDIVPVIFQRYGQKVNTYAFERDVIFVKRELAARVYHRNY